MNLGNKQNPIARDTMEFTVAMKRHSSQLGIWFFAAMMLITGCNKKKQATVPPQAQAHTVSTAPTTQPPQPANQPIVIIPPSNQSGNTTPAKPRGKPKPKPNHARKNPPPANAPANSGTTAGKETNPTVPPPVAAPPTTTASIPLNNAPGKTVIHDGGTSDTTAGAIQPGMDQNEAAQQRHATEQLLQSTDDALKGINRPLNDDERSMVEQIHNYMAQSRAATTDGDLLRANNLAVKAHLLSDALAKH